MRYLLLHFLLFLSLFASAQRFPPQPDPPRLVNDFADILTDEEERRLEQKLLLYNDSTSTEITVVSIDNLQGEDPNLYAAELGQEWGVGRKGHDNGLVFLIAEEDRQMAIQNGYGLEAMLTDASTKMIIEEYILPEFRQGDYYAGIEAGTDQIFKLLAGEFEGKPNRRAGKREVPVFGILILLVILFIFFGGRRKRGGGLRGGGGYWIGGLGGGSFGGSSGGFGGGGGFGGFGGGSFGGGGASGSW